jgi:Fur family ferric uptake transcriptional regulator/Fur family peroxide stress response transcriptional regulator
MIINKRERITNQKRVILDYLKSTETHPTAEKVYFEVKKKLPQISLGTVYRILNNLKEKGEIQEIPSQVSHFDGDILPHAHFICQNCQKIFDVFLHCEILKNQKIKVGKIKNYQIIFYGICKKCQK